MKKIFYSLLSAIFAVMLLFILLITSFEAVCYWTPGYYDDEFRKYQVADELKYWTGEEMSYEAFDEVITQTMSYLRGNRENLIVETEIDGYPQEFYNENEKSHMADVRDLFVLCITLRAIGILCCIAIAAFLIILEHGRAFHYLGRGFFRVCIGIFLVAAGFGILAASDFTKYFTIFHEIFFSQGNWMFDPRESRMINMLPEGFFSDTALRILLCFLGSVLVLMIPSFFLSRKKK